MYEYDEVKMYEYNEVKMYEYGVREKKSASIDGSSCGRSKNKRSGDNFSGVNDETFRIRIVGTGG